MKRKKILVRKIGVFGGTFNPIHNGHIKMAEVVKKKLNLDVIYFIPSGNPPHKQSKDLLPAKLRYDLVVEATKEKEYFEVLDIEIKKENTSYTINTIKKLQREINNKFSKEQMPEWYFILGQDQFEKLQTWHRMDELAKRIIFVVIPRNKELKRCREVKTPNIKNLKYKILKMKPIMISSKEIRKQMDEGKSVNKLVPFRVLLTSVI